MIYPRTEKSRPDYHSIQKFLFFETTQEHPEVMSIGVTLTVNEDKTLTTDVDVEMGRLTFLPSMYFVRDTVVCGLFFSGGIFFRLMLNSETFLMVFFCRSIFLS
jgi:hypothetical protein